MNNIEQFEVQGLSDVVKALQELPIQLQDKLIKSFLQKTGKKFIVNELKSALPYSSKTLKGIRTLSDKKDKNAVFTGVSSDVFWLRFVDKGTKERQTRKGYNRGSITPKNQVRSVIDSQIQPVIDYARDEFGNEINKNLERRIKKINK